MTVTPPWRGDCHLWGINMLERDILISETESIKEALKKLSRTGKKVLLVVDGENSLKGTITDGDIRRGLLKDKNLEDNIRDVFNKRPFYLKKEDYSLEKAKEIMLKEVIELLPIVEDGQRVTEYLTWDEAFAGAKPTAAKIDNIPVVIMAGGKGSRLEPFTKILPKPLIPIGEKAIVEIIIDEFRQQGIKDFYLILNQKSKMVESYFNGITKDYKLKLIKEDRFLGTAGGLKLLKDKRYKIAETFIVSNCDVIVRANLAELINVHREKQAEMTILTSIQHYKIPYGVIAFKEQGEVVSITEKPEYTFSINTGMYVLNRTALEFIRIENQSDDPTETLICNMPTLVSSLLSHKKKVIMYPVNENNYIDIGQWEEYKKAVEKLQFFK